MAADSSPGEWKQHWPLVLAATAGFSFHSIATYSIGLFIEPLSQEFGWSRTQITAGLSLAAIATVPLSPAVGALIDRWGSRRLALPGLVLSGIAFSSFGLANGSTAQWLALWSFYALIAMAVKSTVWIAAVSGSFTAARGMALAVTLSGSAIAQILVPPLANWLIENFGWRQAFLLLGAGWGAFALILASLFLYDAHDRARQKAPLDSIVAPVELAGLSFGEAFRTMALLRVALATLFMMLLGIGFIVHQVPILTEAGVSRQNAAFLASLGGVAGIAGKLVTGWMMDRWDAGLVGGVTMLVAAVAFFLLLEPFRSAPLIVLSIILIGYATGTKLQICAYLTSRYGGMRNFGKIFGVMASLIALGAGLGPVTAGLIHDQFGSYTPFLMAGILGSLLSGLLIIGLGPYPNWATAPAGVRTN